jgi:hypothetical protein
VLFLVALGFLAVLAYGTVALGAAARHCSWPTAIDRGVATLLDKIRNMRYIFTLSESLSCLPKGGREDRKLWLFEMLAHNLPREPGRRRDFLNYIARNPLKRLDPQK